MISKLTNPFHLNACTFSVLSVITKVFSSCKERSLKRFSIISTLKLIQHVVLEIHYFFIFFLKDFNLCLILIDWETHGHDTVMIKIIEKIRGSVLQLLEIGNTLNCPNNTKYTCLWLFEPILEEKKKEIMLKIINE